MYGKSTGNGELKREELTKGGWTNVGRERKGEYWMRIVEKVRKRVEEWH